MPIAPQNKTRSAPRSEYELASMRRSTIHSKVKSSDVNKIIVQKTTRYQLPDILFEAADREGTFIIRMTLTDYLPKIALT